MIPYRIETLFQYEPWANKALFGLTIATSLALQLDVLPEEAVRQYFIWGEGGPLALFGYMFAHAGLMHLAGNMVFLWVFGNAVCATVGNWTYLALYLGLGAVAGLVHMVVGGEPVVGASGAIAGVVGLAVAFYPTNRVNLYYSLGLMPRTGRVALWLIALYWTAWDVIGAALHLGPVAYWTHLGGTTAGLAAGLLLLATERVQLTEFDDGSVLDYFLRRQPPHKLQANSASFEAEAELRRAQLAFRSSAPAMPVPHSSRAESPEAIPRATLALPQSKPQPTTPAIQLGGGVPLSQPTITTVQPVVDTGSRPDRPRFATLPDVRYFLFDREHRRGPMRRAEFLTALASAPDTTGWWYWGEGMADWQPIEVLQAPAKPGYRLARPATR